MLPETIQITFRIAEVLEDCDIPYYVGGSIASSILGEPRSTNDIDLVADFRFEHIPLFRKIVEGEFYLPSADFLKKAIEDCASFNVIHLKTAMKVDIFILQKNDFAREEMKRRQRRTITKESGRSVFVATPEDIVLRKLLWYRKANQSSDRQWRDVLGVLKLQAERLDFHYLKSMATRLEVADLMDKALLETRTT